MTRREYDNDGWPYVTTPESWVNVIAAGIVFLLECAALVAILVYLAGPVK